MESLVRKRDRDLVPLIGRRHELVASFDKRQQSFQARLKERRANERDITAGLADHGSVKPRRCTGGGRGAYGKRYEMRALRLQQKAVFTWKTFRCMPGHYGRLLLLEA